MFSRPSASSLSRALSCLASTLLPQNKEDTASEVARFGTEVHAFLAQALLNVSVDQQTEGAADLADCHQVAFLMRSDDRDWMNFCGTTCDAIDLAKIIRPGDSVIAVEQAYAVNFAAAVDAETTAFRARCLGEFLDRKYEIAATEIAGTCDALLEDHRGFPVVVDFKTGSQKYVPAAVKNSQMKLIALAVLLCRKAEGRPCSAVAARIIFVNRSGAIWIDEAEYSENDLIAFAWEVFGLFQNAAIASRAGAMPDPVIGAYCDHCPSFRHCPAQNALARAVSGMLTKEGQLTDQELFAGFASMSPANARKFVETLQAFDRLSKRLWRIFDAAAQQESIRLSEGQSYGEVESIKEYVNADKAVPILSTFIGEDAAQGLVKKSLSKAAIERAMGGKRKAVAAINALRSNGALIEKRSKGCKVFTPGLPAKEEEEE
jgi:hypothetical protein